MNKKQLFQEIQEKQSFLCIGLDTDLKRIPRYLLNIEEDPVFAFNKAIIDATYDLCVAYKPNIAFYEALGPSGWRSLEKTIDYIPETHLVIADAKRGDIGNTSKMYAKTFFETYQTHAITVAPYMGHDSVMPFLLYKDKWVILLALTSNDGSKDFQWFGNQNGGLSLHEHVLQTASHWATEDQMMFVVGATNPESFQRIREIVPNHFLLVPGIGAQGGDLQAVCEYGLNDHCGLLVSSSREIIYASNGLDFAGSAKVAASKLQQQMAQILKNRKLL